MVAKMQMQYSRIIASNNETKLLVGKLLANSLRERSITNIHEAEFKVFSQWGDDGIIQYLISHLDMGDERFIEFGVGDYTESNTRFLLLNDNWTGLVMDCSKENVESIKNDELYWKYDLTAKHAFVTVENVNATLTDAGFTGDIGLLHIDIDGNDYWVWKAVDCISPRIVVIEYNSLFGVDRAITIPYDPGFDRMKAHHSGLYAGASLLALCDLAHEKGYYFVGSNSAGNNAYFVRNDQRCDLPRLAAREGYVASKFREHRDEHGSLTYLSGHEAIKSVKDVRVVNTRTNEIEVL